MSWQEMMIEKAKKRIAQEEQLLKETYSPDFQKFTKETNLFFSFGDVCHFIRIALRDRVFMRRYGGGAGIACFEDLIKRLRLYLIAELKFVLEGKEPFGNVQIDVNFVSDFEDEFKLLDRIEEELDEIRWKEGGYYQ